MAEGKKESVDPESMIARTRFIYMTPLAYGDREGVPIYSHLMKCDCVIVCVLIVHPENRSLLWKQEKRITHSQSIVPTTDSDDSLQSSEANAERISGLVYVGEYQDGHIDQPSLPTMWT